MTRNRTTDSGAEPDLDALRSGLRTRADLVTIVPPPIPAVRRNARRRRIRRRTVQGLSGVVAAGAMTAGVLAWSPGQDVGIGPSPTTTVKPTAPRTAALASPRPTHTTVSTAPPPVSTTPGTVSPADYLLASDLGAGWTGPDSDGAVRTALSVGDSQCEIAGVYKRQVPVTPAANRIYRFSASGQQPNVVFEAVYTFSPGTGPTVMANVRAALKTGCDQPKSIKLLATPPTVADEAIVFTVGGNSRNVLVRSGDQVASIVVSTVPDGPDGTAWITKVARQMAVRLTAG